MDEMRRRFADRKEMEKMLSQNFERWATAVMEGRINYIGGEDETTTDEPEGESEEF